MIGDDGVVYFLIFKPFGRQKSRCQGVFILEDSIFISN